MHLNFDTERPLLIAKQSLLLFRNLAKQPIHFQRFEWQRNMVHSRLEFVMWWVQPLLVKPIVVFIPMRALKLVLHLQRHLPHRLPFYIYCHYILDVVMECLRVRGQNWHRHCGIWTLRLKKLWVILMK